MKKIIIRTMMAAALLTLAACGTKKAVIQEDKPKVDATSGATKPATKPDQPKVDAAQQAELQKMDFLHRVAANACSSKFVSSKISLNIQSGSKNITVPGIIRMKKDDVIRIHVQIPLLGSEVGRMEFTRDYVLILDRMHKQYFKADYNQVDFLKRHGLTFSSLQALFWNELTVAGHEKLNDKALQQLKVTLGQPSLTPIALNNGNMSYLWHADNQTALIKDVAVSYGEKTANSTKLTINYDDFKALGVSMFPSKMNIGMTTNAIKGKARNIKLSITLNNATNNSDWETRTEISKKYKEVSADDVLKILMNL